MYFVLLLLWLIDGRLEKNVALKAILASILAFVITEMVRNFIPTIRPFRVNGFPPLTVTVPGLHSFPSSHTAVAFAMAITLFKYSRKIGISFILAAVAVALGRIFANVHYLSDIFGGIFVGFAAFYLLDKLNILTIRKKHSKAKRY